MRTSAELLRQLSQKQDIDNDSKDMLALLVYCLRDIYGGIDESASAWGKRDYWMKAEEFRERWRWSGELAKELETLVFQAQWQELPSLMLKLFPHFADIKVNKYTRKETLWRGCYKKLINEHET
jgi:hypothetical protein